MKKPSRNLRQIISAALCRRTSFGRDERGVTAVEFGLLALPFFSLIGAILETAIIFLATQVLDGAVQDSSRLIRTGQAQISGYSQEAYKAAMCDRLFGLFDCTKLKVRVSTLSDFSTASMAEDVIDPETGDWELEETYNEGVGSSIVLVEAYYKWPTYLDFFGLSFATLPDNKLLIAGVRVFRNEPFSS